MSPRDPVPASVTAPPVQSEGFRAYLAGLRRDALRVRLMQGLAIVVFIALWEIAPKMQWVNPMLTSNPSAVADMFVTLLREHNLGLHVWVTLKEAIVSFVVAMVAAVIVAMALWWSNILYRILDPFLVVANSLPKLALAPILYIWLGDQWSVYGIAIAISVFLTILMVYGGFRETDEDKIKLVRTFGGSKWQILTKVVLPANIPVMIGALKINVGLALVGVIAGEFQASKAGLGYLIIYGSQILQMHMVMASIAILAAMSVVMYMLIAWLERAVTHDRG
jgi:NitT/TauT family transport system permease protein